MKADELEQALVFLGAEIKKLPGRRIATLGEKKIFFTIEKNEIAYCEAREYAKDKNHTYFKWHEIASIADAVLFLGK